MRKLLVLVSLVVMLFAALPVMAQEEPTLTIAEIVVASTEAEAPEFTVLLAAVAAADPIFLEVLSDPETYYTVFAPTDAAFVALLEALGVTAEELLANTELLNTVLAYHVVPGIYDATTVVGFDGAYLGTILPGYAVFISVEGESVFVNDSTVVAADVTATNGIVHVIDAVLVPEAEEAMAEEPMATEEPMMEEPVSIAEIVVASTEAETPEFSVLLAAVGVADPLVLELLSGISGPFTVFAPTDAAFVTLLGELGVTAEELLGNTELVNTVLAYHVVPGSFTAEDFVSYLGEEESVLFATVGGSVVSFNGTMINASTLVATDIAASNGVVHVIDTVLVPAAE
ncbi:MAG: fasciclin domain-containing protein [Armatimonadetes bacterium]|nr:fasciclin domain-containing protein [Anaerolineae bacterium]